MFYSKILDKDKSLDFETRHKYILGDHILDHIVKFGGRTCLKYEVHSNLGLSKEFWEELA
jgi:hypothetical protein